MRAMGRRGFLSGAFLQPPPNPPKPDGGSLSDGPPSEVGRTHRSRFIPIGGIAGYPVGETRTIPEEGIQIESLAEGLRARSPERGGPHFAIASAPFGGLVVDRGRIWPASTVYSVLTDGPADISTPWEEET